VFPQYDDYWELIPIFVRWFLLMFKNEFKMSDILQLWDVMFSQHTTAHFEIFVASGIILMHKEQVNLNLFKFINDILQFHDSSRTELHLTSFFVPYTIYQIIVTT